MLIFRFFFQKISNLGLQPLTKTLSPRLRSRYRDLEHKQPTQSREGRNDLRPREDLCTNQRCLLYVLPGVPPQHSPPLKPLLTSAHICQWTTAGHWREPSRELWRFILHRPRPATQRRRHHIVPAAIRGRDRHLWTAYLHGSISCIKFNDSHFSFQFWWIVFSCFL